MFRGIQRHFAAEGEVATGGGATPVVAPAAVAPTAPVVETEPHWLPARLERERVAAEKNARTALLKEIGVSDPAAAAKLVADEAKRLESEKSLELRATESEKALAAERLRIAELSGTVSTIATERLAGLTDAQRAAVAAIAGDDASAQLRAIAALAPTWAAPAASAASASTAAPATAAPAPAAPPANTAPGQTAPSQTTTSQPDHKAEYKRLKAENPVLASAYLNKHESQIYPRA